jgi:serine/threonine protein kinase
MWKLRRSARDSRDSRASDNWASRKPFPIVVAITTTLDYAHRHNVIHRDTTRDFSMIGVAR